MRTTQLDALIVGAGFGGIYELYTLRKQGLSVKAIDVAGDVGGTWYWNRYPGAMSDSESFVYRYSWDKDDLQTYPWPNHYLRQPEILAYLQHVVRKHDLRKDIQFNTELQSAEWDSENDQWRVTVSTDEVFETRYLITALGLLSKAHFPDISGLNTFQGELCHTSAWNTNIQLADKRVGIIGNGSTGVQVVTEIAPIVKSLVSFQRHPQYSVPSGNKPVKPEYRQWVNEHYDEIIADMKKSSTCFGFTESTVTYSSVPAEQREAVFQKLWDQGNGFRFMFGGFSDITTDEEANEAACNFIKTKISETVKDPKKARKLTPSDAYARRPLCDGGYYQQFNRENIDVINLQETPIDSIVPSGIKTNDGKLHELDVLIIATGFDAVEGSYNRLRIRGKSGNTLADRWKNGPTSYLGCFVSDFPNLCMITGPQGPFTNLPPAIEVHVELNSKLIQEAEEKRKGGSRAVIEPTPEAEAEWVTHCNELASTSLFRNIPSWVFANVPGAPAPIPRFYFGGMASYLKVLEDVSKSKRGFQ